MEARKVILERCPSCGEGAKVVGSSEVGWSAKCCYCKFNSGRFKLRSNAIKRWNTRTKETLK